jgi:hypothetical protein
MEEGRNAFKSLTDSSTGNRPSGRPRHKWEDNIRMDYWRILVNETLNLRVP